MRIANCCRGGWQPTHLAGARLDELVHDGGGRHSLTSAWRPCSSCSAMHECFEVSILLLLDFGLNRCVHV